MVGALQDAIWELKLRAAYQGPLIQEIKDIMCWGRGFDLDHRDFRAGPAADPRYLFRHMVRTNGVSVSIRLVRRDMREATRVRQRRRGPKPVPPCGRSPKDCSEQELQRFHRRRLVVIDSGMGNLLHAVDGVVQMQYSRSQLYMEGEHDPYQRRRRQLAPSVLQHRGDAQAVQEWDTNKSDQRQRLQVAKSLDHAMCAHHAQRPYRKLRHQHRCNEQRADDWTRNRFQTLYGKPSEVLVLFGDRDTRNHHRKGSPPAKVKRRWELFEKCG
ncbi:hypothetical protein CDCA_CDCA14G3877 [Cyanidium caldarium]|uniref:Uncharacterized protein n=1 Tax=Cyanidium caldarium TaxID=2771 RepID=A0AAV9IZU8_CYACA|nr:hypothetical protein CDCA_CDCA14G3877 [Cyanidium caldarium]